jgi:DNA-binding NarL/FixJ family response regulator
MIRLLLVDDHTSFRGALAIMLGREDDITVVGEAGNLADADAILQCGPVDVALVDLDLAGEDGVSLVNAMHTSYPESAAIVLTGNQRPESRAMAVAAGAVGVLLKTTSIPDVLAAVRTSATGESLISPAEIVALYRGAAAYHAKTAEGERAMESLTPPEADMLRALAEGLDNQAIADQHYISHKTVRSHIVRILRKWTCQARGIGLNTHPNSLICVTPQPRCSG